MSVDIAGGGLPLQLMKTAMFAESSSYFHFHRDLYAPAMSTHMYQVGVALFPFLKYFFSFSLFRFSFYIKFN